MSEASLAIIIVNWNGLELLKACLRSVYKSRLTTMPEVFVVDNASSDGSSEMVEREFPQVRLVSNSDNVGFAKGNNQALRLASSDYMVLLNPDTLVLEDSFHKMLCFIESHEEVGALGCKLINATGECEPGGYRYPRLFSDLVAMIGWNLPWYRKFTDVQRKRNAERPGHVDWVSGACLMVRREVVKKAGLLNESYFLYSEDTDWCFKINKAGWQVFYYPEATVFHFWRSLQKRDAPVVLEHLKSKYIFYLGNYGKRHAQFFTRLTVMQYWLEAQKIKLKMFLTSSRVAQHQQELKDKIMLMRAARDGFGI